MFEWAYSDTTKLGFVLIANTMDFPEKLSGRVNSRMGDHRVVFKPYTNTEVMAVISDRLKGCKYF